uniref:Uncharacterized protein n=1 Tax=Nelumbo nucifera TaxID=4432 RepID=A0A822ZQ94_NELNU|nr:TPA_asm: hypothetical protein HUJ06_016597 [Nelumbo nucifera]
MLVLVDSRVKTMREFRNKTSKKCIQRIDIYRVTGPNDPNLSN